MFFKNQHFTVMATLTLMQKYNFRGFVKSFQFWLYILVCYLINLSLKYFKTFFMNNFFLYFWIAQLLNHGDEQSYYKQPKERRFFFVVRGSTGNLSLKFFSFQFIIFYLNEHLSLFKLYHYCFAISRFLSVKYKLYLVLLR